MRGRRSAPGDRNRPERSGGTVCIYRDGGLSWSPVNVGASTDGGLTWSALSTGTTADITSINWHDFTNLACVPINIHAEAIDPDGTALFVELFINGFSTDNDFVNPTAKFWDNCTPGRYILSALGTDNLGSVGIAEDVAVTVLPPYHILVPRLVQDDLVRLCYAGDTNKNYGLEISTDLIDWTYLGPFFPTNSILQYLDGSVTNTSHRLYRAIELPSKP